MMTKRLSFIIASVILSLLNCEVTLCQKPRFRSLNTATRVLGASQRMPTNAVADDFGPRDLGDDWHGGIDFNAGANDGDNDLWYPMISPQSGVFADFDRMTHGQDLYKYALVNVKDAEGNGTHTLLFGHVFDWTNQFYSVFDSSIILTRCLTPNTDKWGLHLNFTDSNGNLVRHTYGQINGATLDINGSAAGGIYTTTNIIDTTNIFVPIGRSGGTPSNRFLAHLHLNTLPYDTEISSDAINGDPCQFLNIDRPMYDVAVRTENNVNGISIEYPGTNSTKFRARVQMNGEPLNVNRYDKLFDINKVELELKKSFSTEWSKIKGDKVESIISEGGRLGEDVINHTSPINKTNWQTNGINSNAYNGASSGANAKNPWDDFYFIDFPTRIHHMDVLTPASSQLISDLPIKSRYNDGIYNFRVKSTSTSGGFEYDAEQNITLDNFLPFLTNLNATYTNGTNVANLTRVQKDDNPTTNNNGYVFNQGSFSEKPAPPFTGLTVSVTTSEPMQNMSCRLVQDGPIIRNMIISPTNPLKWTYTYLTAPAIFNGGYEIIFTGTDQSGNTLIDVEENFSYSNPSAKKSFNEIS